MISKLEQEIIGLIPWTEPRDPNLGINEIDLGLKFNSIPYESDVAILVPAWYGQLMFLKTSLTTCRKTGKYVICAYDNPFNFNSDINNFNLYLPNPRTWLLPHSWVFKHKTYEDHKRDGWFWDIIYGASIIKTFSNFKYVFCINGDCILENPQGLDNLIDLLGDCDIMAVSRDTILHTCSVLFNINAFFEILNYITSIMKVPVIGSQSPEMVLTDAVNLIGLKEKIAPKQPIHPYYGFIDHYTAFNQESTWKEYLGYRNLWSEFKMCYTHRIPPVPLNYIDDYNDLLYLRNSINKEDLYQYYKTKDRRWLYKYWDANEDGWYNSLYFSLDYYGDTPIIDS